MTEEEQRALIDRVTKFGHSIANRHPQIRDDIVSAATHGAAIALASPRLPADPDGRRKFVWRAAWNMIRRELTFFLKRRPIPFTDLGFEADGEIWPGTEVDWRDEYEAIAASLEGKTTTIFRLAYDEMRRTNVAIGRMVGLKPGSMQYHMKKIRREIRRRHQEEERLA